MTKKELLHEFCQVYVATRISRIQQNIAGIQESLSAETKSSAGDKHETGRAMLQLEREKLGQQLAEIERTQSILSKTPLKTNTKIVGLGSLVITTKATYYIAISAGAYTTNTETIFCISAQTPMATLLMGRAVNDVVSFRGENITILNIT